MAKQNIVPTREISALYFAKHPYRSDINFFAFDLDALRKEITKNMAPYAPDVYEVEFWTKKPTFKKLTKAQLTKLNIK
jgi:hypothetical protein